jgi:hypothetical protein
MSGLQGLCPFWRSGRLYSRRGLFDLGPVRGLPPWKQTGATVATGREGAGSDYVTTDGLASIEAKGWFRLDPTRSSHLLVQQLADSTRCGIFVTLPGTIVSPSESAICKYLKSLPNRLFDLDGRMVRLIKREPKTTRSGPLGLSSRPAKMYLTPGLVESGVHPGPRAAPLISPLPEADYVLFVWPPSADNVEGHLSFVSPAPASQPARSSSVGTHIPNTGPRISGTQEIFLRRLSEYMTEGKVSLEPGTYTVRSGKLHDCINALDRDPESISWFMDYMPGTAGLGSGSTESRIISTLPGGVAILWC